MRSGGDYFTRPRSPPSVATRQLGAYFVEELSAAEVGARFGYSAAVVHQMASELRSGKAAFFNSGKRAPEGAAQERPDP